MTQGDGTSFDVGGHLRRVRRLADLSQRELAAQAGVNQATVARWESGARPLSVDTLVDVLALAGLRLAVIDEQGAPVEPFDPDTVRDNAGRFFPAHLDVAPPDQRPGNRGMAERWDRPPANGWYARRAVRDEACHEGVERPQDHPTRTELDERHRELLRVRRERGRRFARPAPEPPPCTCRDDCHEHPACPSGCPCQCEPAHGWVAAGADPTVTS
jgi:HTH-type transcriptional regulator/antitoxin HipB